MSLSKFARSQAEFFLHSYPPEKNTRYEEMQKSGKNGSKNHSQYVDKDKGRISSLEKKLREDRIFTSKAPIESQIERAFKNGCKEIKICIKGSNGEQVPTHVFRLKEEFKNIFNKEDYYMVTRDKNLLVVVKCLESAVKMLNKTALLDTPIEKVLLESSFTSEYVIKGLDTGIACEEIERLLLLQGVYVHKIVRFTCKGEDALSSTVLIKELGDVDRNVIKLGSVSYEVRRFIEKPKVCSKCLKVGHFHTRCTAKEPKCLKCGENHEATTCSKINQKCFRCGSSNHLALDKRCPVVKKEHDILNLANKENMSLSMAKSVIEEEKEALKAKRSTTLKNQSALSDPDQYIDLEQLGLKGLANAIEELTEAVNNLANVTLELLENQNNQTTVEEVEKRVTSEQSQITERRL